MVLAAVFLVVRRVADLRPAVGGQAMALWVSRAVMRIRL